MKETRKVPGLVIYSYLKDDTFNFLAAKRHACFIVVVKEVYFVPFLSSRYTKGVQFSVKNGM